ncbi:MAG: hypothetical protein ACLFM1_04855 [Bacteroidales bacterium]
MKNFIWIGVAAFMMFVACNSEQENTAEDGKHEEKAKTNEDGKDEEKVKTKQTAKSSQKEKKEIPDGITPWPDDVQKNEEYKVTAYFEKVIAGTDGAIYVFKDAEGNAYELWEESDFTTGLEIADGVEPNVPIDKYKDQWHELTFQIREREFYDGGTGETNSKLVPVVKSFVKIDEADTKVAKEKEVIAFEDVKPGDVIEGHSVVSKDHEKNDHWEIRFDDSFEVSGSLYRNEMSEQYQLKVAAEDLPETKILVEDEEFAMYNKLIIATFEDLPSLLSEETNEQLEAGQSPKVHLKVRNLAIGQKKDKGQLNTGIVELQQVMD